MPLGTAPSPQLHVPHQVGDRILTLQSEWLQDQWRGALG